MHRLLIKYVFIGHGILAISWWYVMPGGFPVSHVRFWSNTIWPLATLAISVFGLAACLRQRESWSNACLIVLAVAALSATATSALIFPDINRRVLLAGSAVGLAELALAFLTRPQRPSFIAMAIVTLSAGAFGCFMPWSLRAEPASTKPKNIPCPWEDLAGLLPSLQESPASVQVSERATLFPSTGIVSVSLERLKIDVEPLLTFVSTSESGGWTILSRQSAERNSWGRRLTKMFTIADEGEEPTPCFRGARDRLRVVDRGSIEITAFSNLDRPIYSHLNTFCVLTISGHQNLQLEFSPCGSSRFEPLPADYPVGRPARFAYCDANRQFRVVEGTSGEKGPFTVLGEGRFEPDAPLTIGLIENGKSIARVRFNDWSMQISTALSPTGGWGVAANAIEFQRLGEGPRDAVMIWVTLAATSVGRGWDTVGHAPGIYRNQLVIDANE